MIDQGKHNILGVDVSVVDYAGAVNRIVEAAYKRQPLAVSALAVHGVMTGVADPEHRYRLNQFDLVCPDGQPVRWALKGLHGVGLADRVYGPQLMLETCEAAAEKGLPIFLFGGSDKLLDKLQSNLLTKFPELRIAGRRASKFRKLNSQEWDELVDEVRESEATILFVGLGCPRQEVFTYEIRDAVSIPTLAVGAAFNFHAGDLPQAPPKMQRLGLEWLYRLIQEPKRLWRRYLLLNPAYVSLLALQKLRLYRVRRDDLQPPESQILYG
ncbi:WecB/TagA/CpsF family glycosyltransferase [Adhaeretor mobilis]|uniref:N-acetylmannosaminyltransferase n=1 Tax=Adhaeretor mobilis TaxID=1930276 RepID=A0A517MVU4_9BACT|nr:WecB/TagA/CpsF family glycosyltransferase [Adhaeretor mobilis]QDS99001.1 Putative N-acetylmannosaminyltransferase [Adhaeretor mobilis]